MQKSTGTVRNRKEGASRTFKEHEGWHGESDGRKSKGEDDQDGNSIDKQLKQQNNNPLSKIDEFVRQFDGPQH